MFKYFATSTELKKTFIYASSKQEK